MCIGQVTPSGTYLLQAGSSTRSYRKPGNMFATHWLTVKDKDGQHVATLKLSRNNATTENGVAAATAEEGDEGLFTSWRSAPTGPEQVTRCLTGGGLFCSETDAIRYIRGTEKLPGAGPSKIGETEDKKRPKEQETPEGKGRATDSDDKKRKKPNEHVTSSKESGRAIFGDDERDAAKKRTTPGRNEPRWKAGRKESPSNEGAPRPDD